jgi:hypothetical protein
MNFGKSVGLCALIHEMLGGRDVLVIDDQGPDECLTGSRDLDF